MKIVSADLEHFGLFPQGLVSVGYREVLLLNRVLLSIQKIEKQYQDMIEKISRKNTLLYIFQFEFYFKICINYPSISFTKNNLCLFCFIFSDWNLISMSPYYVWSNKRCMYFEPFESEFSKKSNFLELNLIPTSFRQWNEKNPLGLWSKMA